MESSTSTEPVERAVEAAYPRVRRQRRRRSTHRWLPLPASDARRVEPRWRPTSATASSVVSAGVPRAWPCWMGRRSAPERRPPRAVRRGECAHRSTARLIAGIGLLLLAMGVGVLIGRSGSTSSKAPPAQVVTVAGAGGAAAGAAATSTAPQAPAGSTGVTKSSSTTVTATKSTSKKAVAPPPKTVKVGSPGKGPGYQHGHFTGNFFGGGESE